MPIIVSDQVPSFKNLRTVPSFEILILSWIILSPFLTKPHTQLAKRR